jgi:TPP-dependent pyruvate/acetoin dehydrogenase alpha subunit
VLFFCENNSPGALGSAGGGFPTSVSAVEDLTTIPSTFGIPVETVDGRDPEAVYEVSARAVDHCRGREGPFFVHVVTDRWAGSQGLWPALVTGELDISMATDDSAIPAGEHADWYREHDPILLYSRRLLEAGEITPEDLRAMDERVTAEMAEAREFAVSSPRPTPESALDNVFA